MTIQFKGGKGSGHHGHSGRPGKVGGSTLRLVGSWMHGPLTFDGDMDVSSASSKVKFATMPDGTRVVYKEQSGTLMQSRGISAHGETGAYVTADALGYEGLVPKSVALDDTRSVQQLLEVGIVSAATNDDLDLDTESYKQMLIMDMVTGNGDRHMGNVWVMPDGKVKAIDNDHAFATKPSYGSVKTDNVRSALFGGMNTYEMLTGGKLIGLAASDFDEALALRSNRKFMTYVSTTFGSDALNLLHSRFEDMQKIQQEIGNDEYTL